MASLLLICIAFGLGAAAPGLAQRPATHPSLVGAELPPLIPAEAFFADRARSWNHKVSPDGRRLMWIAYRNDRPTIHFRRFDGTEQVIDAEKPIYRAHWSYDSRRILFSWDNDGDENHHFYVVDTARPDQPPRDLTPLGKVAVWWHQSFRDDPAHMLVRINDRNPVEHDLYKLNIRTGSLQRIATNPGGGQGWVTNLKGEVVGRLRQREGNRRGLEIRTNDAWRPLIDWNFDEVFKVQGHPPVGGEFLWALSNRNRDKIALVKLDLRSGEEKVVHAYPTVDIDGVWIDEERYQPLRAYAWPDYLDFHHFDADLGSDMALFEQNGAANVWIKSATLDKQVMTVKVETDRTDSAFYLFDRRHKTRTLLAEAPIARRRDELSITRPISFKSRDGLTLHGYLTLPGTVRARNLPMVLRVHGGPWSRDRWGYASVDQFLANRGYAVLAVNYRGSTGYGRAFLQAARREFAGKMHDDLIDGVDWAVRQGIADPEKVAIYGRSYGGYATMVGLTFTPKVFAAGINVVGVADLVMALETFPPYWKPWLERWLNYVGDPKDPVERADMAARSPINFIDRIERPLLMAQGANDVRVVRAHSDRIAAAMKKAGLPFHYMVFDDEGHAIRKWQNRLAVARAMEQFLADHLGGRAAKP